MEKIFIVLSVLLFFSIALMAGISPSYEWKDLPESTHPIDLLVKEKVNMLSTLDFQFRILNKSRYGGGLLLSTYGIFVTSTLKRTSINQVEADFLQLFEKALRAYNDIPEIRPYFEEFPFPPQSFSLWIEYGPQPRAFYALPYYCFAMYESWRQTFQFKRWENLKSHELWSQPTVEKPLSDFPHLLELNNIGMSRSKKRAVMPIVVDTTIKAAVDSIHPLKPLLRDICLQYDVHLSALRSCAIGKWDDRAIAVGFWTQNKEMKLDEARKFAYEFIEDYLGRIRSKKIIEKVHQKHPDVLKDFKENLNWFCFRMTFWDEYVNRVEEPYIAQIQCQDGKIIYYTADEGQKLHEVFEEPVPERFFPRK